MKFRHALAVSAVALIAAIASQANAAVFDFTYTGLDGNNTITVDGLLTTGPGTPSVTYAGVSGFGPDVTGYEVIGISGTRTDGDVVQQITGLIGGSGFQQYVWPTSTPASPPPGWIFDNVTYTGNAPTYVDLYGLEFSAAVGDVTSLYNVYFQNGSYYENFTPLGDPAVTAVVNGVPEPATWVMMIVGFAMVGVAGMRLRRTSPALA